VENAQKNSVDVEFFKYALGSVKKRDLGVSDLVVANILGPLLIRFAGEIAPCVGKRLVISGILNEFYPEVLAAYEKMGFEEISRKTIGEWTTGLLKPVSKNTENV
jgi:ribosomal protein L11 methylase PrmA